MVSGQVCLRRGADTRVRGGAPWIFENELDWADDTCEAGGIVDVLDSRLHFVARGFWNPASKICVRVLTRDGSEGIDPYEPQNIGRRSEFHTSNIQRALT